MSQQDSPLNSNLQEGPKREFFFVFAVCFMSSDSKTEEFRQTKQFLDINYSDECCLKLKSCLRCSAGDASEHFTTLLFVPSFSLIQ